VEALCEKVRSKLFCGKLPIGLYSISAARNAALFTFVLGKRKDH
jgi:hypothetical protein